MALLVSDDLWAVVGRRACRSASVRCGASSTSIASRAKAAERTLDVLWSTVGRITETFTPTECANSFAAEGDDAD